MIVFCENCKSNNTVINWERIISGCKYIYKCRTCIKFKLKNIKNYKREELVKLYNNTFYL